MSPVLNAALDFALPPRCAACGAIVPDSDALCVGCWGQLEFLTGEGCGSCGAPVPVEGAVCAPCLASAPDHDGAHAAVAYGEIARTVVLRLKHGRRIGLARFVAAAMRRWLPEDGTWLVAPVPLHRWRLWRRGFNQSLSIARHLDLGPECHLLPDLLLRTKRTPLLGGLGARERRLAVRGVFAVNPDHAEQIKGRKILLIDDVLTSGATGNACARTLKRAGADEVRLLCWARVVRGD